MAYCKKCALLRRAQRSHIAYWPYWPYWAYPLRVAPRAGGVAARHPKLSVGCLLWSVAVAATQLT